MADLVSKRVSRRSMLQTAFKAAGAAAGAALLAACGGPTPTPVVQVVEKTKVVEVKQTVQVEKLVEKPVVVTATPAPTVAGSDLAADQTIKFVTRQYARMDPASEGGFERFVISHLWMPMFLRSFKQDLQPWLATKYESSADLKSFTLHIDPRAVWSDGSPVKAQEMKDYWTYGLSQACKGCYMVEIAGMDVIEGAKDLRAGKTKELPGLVAKDDKTVVFNLIRPDPLFAHRLAIWNTNFAKMEDVTKQVGDPWAKDAKAFNADATTRVNGPFMIKTWDIEKKKYEITQNPKWWGDKKPKVRGIACQEAADENISMLMWKNNEVDVAQFLSSIREPMRKEQADTFRLIPKPTNFFWYIRPDMEPTDDINLRKALMHAVDFDKAIAAAWEGFRNDRVMSTSITPELNCYKKGNWPEWGYNPAKAKEELAKSKWGTPDKVPTLRITSGGTSPNYLRVGEIMLESWKNNLGLTNVQLKSGSLDAFGQDKDKVNFRRDSQGAYPPDPVAMLAPHIDMLTTNYGLKDPELVAMYEKASSTKRDDPNFCTLAQQLEAKLLGLYVIAPMIWDLYEYNVKGWVKNFEANGDDNWATLLDMYIAKH